MRITNNTMNNAFINNLNKNLQNMQKAQEQLTSGKKVSKPSDDPLLVGKILSMKDNIKQNEQYNSNISQSKGWVQTQDTALADVTKTMNRIRDLIVYGANGSLADTDRDAIQEEVKMKVGEIRDILNTNFDGRYIFAGHKTGEAPFTITDGKDGMLTYNGNGGNIEREISQGVTIELMTDGSEIVGEDNDLGIFLNEIIDAMESRPADPADPLDTGKKADLDKLSGKLLGEADKFIDKILRARSKVGAIDNRLEAAEERNRSENINLTEVLSSKEDIDLAKTYMEYTMMSTAYQTSLSVGAKILQPSLLDYLR